MANGIYSALSGASGRESAMQVLANNMANVGTSGFKRDQVTFKEVLAEADGVVNLTHRQVRMDSVETDFSPGGLNLTGNRLDVAVLGDGFFEVDTPEGKRYTRAGAFALNGDGEMVTADGHKVMGTGGPIQIPQNQKAMIVDNGLVMAGEIEVGRLKVVEFSDRKSLKRAGHNLWLSPVNQKSQEVENLRLAVGAVERSNVSPVKAMTDLIRVSRHYESLLKAVDTFGTADRRTVSDLGR